MTKTRRKVPTTDPTYLAMHAETSSFARAAFGETSRVLVRARRGGFTATATDSIVRVGDRSSATGYGDTAIAALVNLDREITAWAERSPR